MLAYFRFRIALCIALFVATSAAAQLGFEEEPWDGVVTVNPIDTTRGVAIYAAAADPPHDSLPPWWADVWDLNLDNSIPKYYSDNSFGKHGFLPSLMDETVLSALHTAGTPGGLQLVTRGSALRPGPARKPGKDVIVTR